jgi:hypothetical protein
LSIRKPQQLFEQNQKVFRNLVTWESVILKEVMEDSLERQLIF